MGDYFAVWIVRWMREFGAFDCRYRGLLGGISAFVFELSALI